MTLDEAIKHWEEKTEALYKAIPCDGCAFSECVKEHRQLVEWLRELKSYKEKQPIEVEKNEKDNTEHIRKACRDDM